MRTVNQIREEIQVIEGRIRKGTRYKRQLLEAHQAGETSREAFNRLIGEAHTLMRALEEHRKGLNNELKSVEYAEKIEKQNQEQRERNLVLNLI